MVWQVPEIEEENVSVRGGSSYIVLASYALTQLAKAVNSLMMYDRWEPQGGISAVCETDGEATEYMQAMVHRGE